MTDSLFKDKTIMITGASGGIGAAVAEIFAVSGANIVGVYNKNLPCFQAAGNVSLVKADLSEPEAWDRVIHFTIQKYTKLDAMINCMGVLIPGEFYNLSEVQIKEMININFSSAIIGTQKTLKIMKKQSFGHIINIGSIGGVIPMPYCAAYSATKFALRGFTHSIAQEIKGSGIFISLISPGPVDTKMLQKEAADSKVTVSFINNQLPVRKVADSIINTLDTPKAEVIIPSSISFISRMVFLFPGLFSKAYMLLDKIGHHRKRFYKKKQIDYSLQK